jgi:hypothetical protein
VSENSVQILSEKTGHSRRNVEPYSRMPKSVLHDKSLTSTAKCIYADLAISVYQGSVCKIGIRLIAKHLGFNKDTVMAGLKELAACDHITIRGVGKERRTYHLHSDIFGQKQRAGVQEVAGGPSGGQRMVSAPREPVDRAV